MPRETRSVRFGVRLKPSEIEAIRVFADQEGKTVSEFIREGVQSMVATAQAVVANVGSAQSRAEAIAVLKQQQREMMTVLEALEAAERAENQRAAS